MARTLNASLTAAQKAERVDPRYKIQLTLDANDDTWEQDRILSIEHLEQQFHSAATVVLDNSDGTVTADYRGYQGVISYGMLTGSDVLFSATAPLFVINQQEHSSEGALTITLSLIGLADLLAADHASDQYVLDKSDTQTIKTLLKAIVEATLEPFRHTVAYTATFDSEDALLDVFIPAENFSFGLNHSRLATIQDLLVYTKNVMRIEADGAVHFLQPTVSGTTYAYEFKFAVNGEHDIWSKANTKPLLFPNRIDVRNHPDETAHFEGSAEDTASSDLTNMEKREFHFWPVTSSSQAASVASALLEKVQSSRQKGGVSAMLECGLEVHDFINLTDARPTTEDTRKGNIGSITRLVHATERKWEIRIALGDLRTVGYLDIIVPGYDRRRRRVEDTRRGIFSGTDERVRDLEARIINMDRLLEAVETKVAAPATKQDIPTLAVPERLQIPVGPDKFGGRPNAGAIGATIDSLAVSGAAFGIFPHIIHVSGSVFAAVYEGASSVGKCSTFTIDEDGNVGNTVIQTLEFESSDCVHPRIIRHPSSNILFAVTYQNDVTPFLSFIKTFSIFPDGTIGNVIATFEFLDPTNRSLEKDFIHVTGDIFAIAYRGLQGDGYVSTIDIDFVGNIGSALLDTIEFDTSNADFPAIIHVSGQIYAIAYRDTNVELKIATIDIDSAGAIADSVVNTSSLGTLSLNSFDERHSIIKISDGVFVVAYADNANDGQLVSFTISNAGTIGTAPIRTLEFDTSQGRHPAIIKMAPDLYAIAYVGPGNDGFLKTVKIYRDGIFGVVAATLEFDAVITQGPNLISVPLSDSIVAIIYQGDSTIATVLTNKITTLTPGFVWIEGGEIHYIDENGVERVNHAEEVDSPDRATIWAAVGF